MFRPQWVIFRCFQLFSVTHRLLLKLATPNPPLIRNLKHAQCRHRSLRTDFVLSPVKSVHVRLSNIFNILFENWVVRRIFRPNRDEVTGGWRTFHNEELHNLYSLPSIIRMIRSKRMRCTRHVARLGEERMHYFVRKARTKETIRKT
jgi:hypothetical protein